MARIDPNEEARRAASVLPRDVWIIARTSTAEPYPCRCGERFSWQKVCSAAWCPCAGRKDPPTPECCGMRYSPADVVQAKAIYDLEKRRKEREEILG